jgi:hypothetical protein
LPIAGPSTFGVIEANAPIASNWVTGWSAGVPQVSQPTFNDISGTINNSQLPVAGNNTVISNISGMTQAAQPNSLSAVVDSAFGSQSYAVLYRTTSGWVTLPPGIQGQFLATSGASNAPQWANAAGGGTVQSITPGVGIFLNNNPCTVSCAIEITSSANNTVLANVSGGSTPPTPTSPSQILDIFGSAQGDVLYRGSGVWQALVPGATSPQQFLQTNGAGATPSWAGVNLSRFTNSLSGDVNLTSTSTFFTGPTVAQGTSGTWFASGTVTLTDTAQAGFVVRLWDGTTVIASGECQIGIIFPTMCSVSGYITNPAGNIRIDVKDASTTNGKIKANASGLGNTDSTLTVIRIQ